MAKQASTSVEKLGLVARLKGFVREVRVELSKVSWPNKEEVKSSTSVVLFLLAVLATIVFVYDFVFSKLVIALGFLLG